MTCPMCNDTGRIVVINIDHAAKTGHEEWRRCPICDSHEKFEAWQRDKNANGKTFSDEQVKLLRGNGVSGNGSLEGSERTLDYGAKRKRHIRAGHAKRARQWYMGD